MRVKLSLEPDVEVGPGVEFRIQFWERPRVESGWNLESWDISGASIAEVLAWVAERSRGRVTQILARGVHEEGQPWVTLTGKNPTASGSEPTLGWGFEPQEAGTDIRMPRNSAVDD